MPDPGKRLESSDTVFVAAGAAGGIVAVCGDASASLDEVSSTS